MARIVVVDDDEVLLAATVAILNELGGHVATGTGYPARALSALTAGVTYDLLITDIRMPLMSGPELAERARDLCPELAVLYMSGFVFGVPGGHFLPKPFSATALLDAVEEALAVRGAPVPEPPPPAPAAAPPASSAPASS